MANTDLIIQEDIIHKIYTFRDTKIMLDNDLAKLYSVPTKRLNESVKRNIDRFPEDFMFQLTEIEKNELVANCDRLKALKHSTNPPYVFTEQGVAMLSGILKSKRAIETNILIIRAFVSMRKFLHQNADLFLKIDNIEKKQTDYQIKTNKKINALFEIIENKDHIKKQGIFYNGQIFDAYKFISELINSAKESIILIDNYVDESVLIRFSEIKNLKVTIYTENLTEKLKLDLERYNAQYNRIEIKQIFKSHDRFLIIDKEHIYHLGASIKDLGKKWFVFSKLNKNLLKPILSQIK